MASAKLPLNIWKEPKFRDLGRYDQWAYLMLLTNPDHRSNLGLLSITPNRWARLAADLNPVTCLEMVRSLAIKSWVVIDESTDELFIPRFMEFNHVLNQPNVLRGAIGQVPRIWSPAIKLAVADVLDTVNTDDARQAASEIRSGTRLTVGPRPVVARRVIPADLRHSVYVRDGWRCVYCGLQFAESVKGRAPEDESLGVWLELDHIKPYSLGGEDTYENLRSACSPCNRKRGVDDADLWAERMVGR